MVIVLAVMTVTVPFRIITENWRQIAGMAPDADLQKRFHRLVEPSLAPIPCDTHHLRIARLGRLVHFQLYVIVSAAEENGFGTVDQDALRRDIYERVGREFPHLAMDVILTADAVWSERSIAPA